MQHPPTFSMWRDVAGMCVRSARERVESKATPDTLHCAGGCGGVRGGGRGCVGGDSLDLLQCAELVNQVGEVAATAVLRENSSRRLLRNPH